MRPSDKPCPARARHRLPTNFQPGSPPHPSPMNRLLKITWFLVLPLCVVLTAPAAVLSPYRATGWKYKLGTTEASNPIDAWRSVDYDDSAWSSGAAPIGYPSSDGGPLEVSIQTTLPTSTAGGYTCVFLRKTFVVNSLAQVPQLDLAAQFDDGFVAWINGVEIGRSSTVAGGPVSVSTLALDHEVTVSEAALTLAVNPGTVLGVGTNVLAIQLFN